MKKLLIVLLVLGLAVPAMAAEWNFYGSARMATFYTTKDVGDLEDAGVAYDDSDLAHGLEGISRFGGTVKTSDVIGGCVELAVGGGNVGTRKLYGTYNFGAGELLVGQTYTPGSASFFYSNSVYSNDGDLLGLGAWYVGRRPMVQLTIDTFKVALVSPEIGTASLTDGTNTYNDADVSLPKIEASYAFKSDAFFLNVFGGFETYDLEDNANDESKSVTSWAVGVGGGMTFGPATISAAVNTGINYGTYGAVVGFDRSVTLTAAEAAALGVGTTAGTYGIMSALSQPILYDDDVQDTAALQAMLVANFILADNFSLEAGFGYSQLSNDKWEDAYGADEDSITQMQYYVNCVYTFAPGFFIVPEVGIIDYGDLLDGDTSMGTDTYVGLKWQIDF